MTHPASPLDPDPPQKPPELTGEPTEDHDRAVQAALYKRAVGSERWREVASKLGVVMVREEVPADPAAAKLWLQARRPEQWAEKRTQEFRVIVARIEGRETEAVGMVIEHQPQEQSL